MKQCRTFRNSILVLSALLMVFDLALAANPQRDRDRGRDRDGGGRWEYLGQAHVDGRSDHDRIMVNSGQSLRSMLLEVQGGAVEFNRVVVHFENGGDHEVQVRDNVRSGGRTRAIDLPGDRRRIRSVELWYEKGNWRRRPTVKLYGRR
ncbi:MAG: hypothetical protein AABO41_00085 [Acidobacteriota bacterium]